MIQVAVARVRMPARQVRIALVFWAILTSATTSSSQNLGTAPSPGLGGPNIYTAFKIASNDTPGNNVADSIAALQVTVRARKLGISSQSSVEAWRSAQSLAASPALGFQSSSQAVPFGGSTASALNAFLLSSPSQSVRLTSPSLTVDQPIDVPHDGIVLDFAATQVSASGSQPYLLRISGLRNVSILGGQFVKGNSAILISKSSNVAVTRSQFSGLTGDGIVVVGSSLVTISHSLSTGLAGAGVVLGVGTTRTLVQTNDFSNGVGQSNWAAAIVITDRDVDFASNPQSIFDGTGYWPVIRPIKDLVDPPRDSLIANNHISTNSSSGIYVDGGVRITIASNVIQGNAKEGLCLDNGSTANVVTANVIQENGKRWGQPDDVLARDFVSGRLPDGTAAAKLPGISIDNAMYNVVFGNNISHNFGGGVKMVRTAFFNLVGMNVIDSDNDGVSIYYRFFGIELGAAAGDASSVELDFTPSRGNILFSNLIRGSNASGIFVVGGSDGNQFFDNVIREATDWAIESGLPMANISRDNLTDLPSLNVLSGCCRGELRGNPLPRR